MKYYVTDYWTDEIIDVTTNFDDAVRICSEHDGSQVELDNDEVLYCNITLPF